SGEKRTEKRNERARTKTTPPQILIRNEACGSKTLCLVCYCCAMKYRFEKHVPFAVGVYLTSSCTDRLLVRSDHTRHGRLHQGQRNKWITKYIYFTSCRTFRSFSCCGNSGQHETKNEDSPNKNTTTLMRTKKHREN
ncbi:unnamed protein product, partial [Ectocarpus sp. 12 AP-2014]